MDCKERLVREHLGNGAFDRYRMAGQMPSDLVTDIACALVSMIVNPPHLSGPLVQAVVSYHPHLKPTLYEALLEEQRRKG